jgi:hypothetical protein
MAGQTNSWIGKINISPIPCIGDTVRKVSSTSQNQYGSGGDTSVEGESTTQTASLWWLIGAGLLIGLLMKSKSQRY